MAKRIKSKNETSLSAYEKYRTPFRIVLYYGIFGVLWILFSDMILNSLVVDVTLNQKFQTFKGWFYILITCGLLYRLIYIDYQKVVLLNSALSDKNEALIKSNRTISLTEKELRLYNEALIKAKDQMFSHQHLMDVIIEHSDLMMVAWDYNTKVSRVNQMFLKRTNMVEKDIIGKEWLSLVDQEVDQQIYLRRIEEIISGRNLKKVEGETFLGPSKVVWTHAKVTDFRSGHPIIVSIGLDLTDVD